MDLRTYLFLSRMTIKEFAAKIGVPTQLMSSWKRRKVMPSAKNIYLMQQYSNGAIKLEDWVTGEDSNNKHETSGAFKLEDWLCSQNLNKKHNDANENKT